MTYTEIERRLGFSVPVTYLSLIENYDYVAQPLIATLAVRNKVNEYTCRIIFINGQSRGFDTNSDFSKIIYKQFKTVKILSNDLVHYIGAT
jgi:hypothetical protein